MSLEISLLYLEKESITKYVARNFLKLNGFKVKVYKSLENALKFTDIGKYDFIIAHLKPEEYKPLFELAKKENLFVAIAPSYITNYTDNPEFLRITEGYDLLIFEGAWYTKLKPRNVMPFIKNNHKQK